MAAKALLVCLCLSQSQASGSYKLISLAQAYFGQDPSAGLVFKRLDQGEELPIYRDLPPIKRSTPEDLTEALEATRNLKFLRPELDAEAFYEGLRKAAEETRAVVANIAPSAPLIHGAKVNKSTDLPQVKENAAEEKTVVSKGEPEAKASELAVSVQAPFTNVQVRKGAVLENDPPPAYSGPPPGLLSGLGVHVEAPFTSVQVRKGAVLENDPPPAYAGPPPGPQTGFGVHVEAPFTSVQVSKGAVSEYGQSGVDLAKQAAPHSGVRVNVEAPFVQVRKLSAPYPSEGDGSPGARPSVGVNVEAPFVKVNVDNPGGRTSFLSDFLNAAKRQHKTPIGEQNYPTMFNNNNGKPLDLDINIPGIFNLKLLRDENGRGRLGIGVLPIISSLVNKQKTLDSYPGPPHA